MSKTNDWFERRATGPRPGRWFASEWGMAILALVLALLVWAVVWREISAQDEPFEVRLNLETSPGFAAFYEGRVVLTLKGPRGEIDDARRTLSTPPILNVRLPDLAPKEDHREVQITREMVDFPFPIRLVGAVELEGTARLPRADVYRLRDQQITFLEPEVTGVPAGIGCDVVMEPLMHPVRGPAGKVGTDGDTIRPDPIDLSPYFPEEQKDLPGETRLDCAFSQWRHDPTYERYRRGIALPKVEAVFRFSFEAEREIPNRLVIEVPADYEVSADVTERYYAEGRYRGRFAGRQRDLDRLERSTDSWWFVVRVPNDKLPAEGEAPTREGLVEFFHAGSLDDLQVKLVSSEVLVFGIKRREAP